MVTAFGIILIVLAAFLIFAVLMQSGKDKRLSGAIVGGADTFFSKGKAKTMDKILDRLTIIIGFVFAIVCLAMYLIVV